MVQGNATNDFLVTCSYPGPSVEWAIVAAWTPIGSSSHTFQGCGSISNRPDATWVSKNRWAYASTNLDSPPAVLESAARAALAVVQKLASPCVSPTKSSPPKAPAPAPAPEAPPTSSSPSSSQPSTEASPTSPATGSTAPAGQPLCDEAIQHFGDGLSKAGVSDPKVTRLRTNRTEILTGFASVITAYNVAHPHRPARSPFSSATATMGAIDWLWEPGGLSSKILDKVGLVENSPGKAYVTGTEQRLADKITRSTHPLLPAEVFSLALDLNNGNVTNALLTAHNTLRALGRVDAVNQTLTRVLPERTVYGKHLADLRSGAENSGPWYHLFGTAYFELMWTATGRGAEAAQALAFGADGLPAGALAVGNPAVGNPAVGTSALGTSALGTAADHFAGQLPPTSTLSGFANWLEQKIRASVGSKADAEKYCLNVWGAQLGAVLAQMMGGTTTYKTFEEDMSVTEFDAFESPFSMRWKTPQGTTTIDQKTGVVRFGTPLIVYPLNEGSTWGAAIVPPAQTSGTVTFVATKAGADLHFLRVNTAAGQAVLYRATAHSAGDEMTLALGNAAFGQDMTTSDGRSIAAQRLALTTPGSVDDASSDTSASRTRDLASMALLAAALAGIVVLGVGSALLARRRRRRRA